MEILIKPIVTEKMTSQGEAFNRYGFLVTRKANKLQIKKAVEELYGVNVEIGEHHELRWQDQDPLYQEWYDEWTDGSNQESCCHSRQRRDN
jgi:hypothetical protein